MLGTLERNNGSEAPAAGSVVARLRFAIVKASKLLFNYGVVTTPAAASNRGRQIWISK